METHTAGQEREEPSDRFLMAPSKDYHLPEVGANAVAFTPAFLTLTP